MNYKKIIALLTISCFTFTFIISQPLHAVVEKRRAINGYKDVFDSFVLPSSYGRITEQRIAESVERIGEDNYPLSAKRSTLVVNIQDLHCHPEVQRNISKILEVLDKKYSLKNVYIEGSCGALNTSWLTRIRDKKLRNEILDALLNSGKLTGAEHYAAVSERNDLLIGVENKKLHTENMLRLSRIVREQPQIKEKLEDIKDDLTGLEDRYYNRSNKKLNKVVKKFKAGKLKPEKYYDYLIRKAEKLGVDLGSFKNLSDFTDSIETSKRVDYKAVAREMKEFIIFLKSKLPYNTYSLLIERTANFSKANELYIYLSRIADKKPSVLDKFPNLKTFFANLDLNQRINPLELIKEEQRLLDEIRLRLAQKESEREILFLIEFTRYLGDYLSYKISAEDYEYINKNFAKFELLWTRYVGNGKLSGISAYLQLLNDYYAVNLKRNDCLFANCKVIGHQSSVISQQIQTDDRLPVTDYENVVVLITGGFHTSGLKGIFKEKGVPYIVITPNVTEDTTFAESVYSDLIQQQSRILSNISGPAPVDMLALETLTRLMHTDESSPGEKVLAGRVYTKTILDKEVLENVKKLGAEVKKGGIEKVQEILDVTFKGSGLNIGLEEKGDDSILITVTCSDLQNPETFIYSIETGDINQFDPETEQKTDIYQATGLDDISDSIPGTGSRLADLIARITSKPGSVVDPIAKRWLGEGTKAHIATILAAPFWEEYLLRGLIIQGIFSLLGANAYSYLISWAASIIVFSAIHIIVRWIVEKEPPTAGDLLIFIPATIFTSVYILVSYITLPISPLLSPLISYIASTLAHFIWNSLYLYLVSIGKLPKWMKVASTLPTSNEHKIRQKLAELGIEVKYKEEIGYILKNSKTIAEVERRAALVSSFITLIERESSLSDSPIIFSEAQKSQALLSSFKQKTVDFMRIVHKLGLSKEQVRQCRIIFRRNLNPNMEEKLREFLDLHAIPEGPYKKSIIENLDGTKLSSTKLETAYEILDRIFDLLRESGLVKKDQEARFAAAILSGDIEELETLEKLIDIPEKTSSVRLLLFLLKMAKADWFRKILENRQYALILKLLKASRNIYHSDVLSEESFSLIEKFVNVPGMENKIFRIESGLSVVYERSTSIFGELGELKHAEALEGAGFEIIYLGLSMVTAEIDIVARKDGQLYFIEIKNYVVSTTNTAKELIEHSEYGLKYGKVIKFIETLNDPSNRTMKREFTRLFFDSDSSKSRRFLKNILTGEEPIRMVLSITPESLMKKGERGRDVKKFLEMVENDPYNPEIYEALYNNYPDLFYWIAGVVSDDIKANMLKWLEDSKDVRGPPVLVELAQVPADLSIEQDLVILPCFNPISTHIDADFRIIDDDSPDAGFVYIPALPGIERPKATKKELLDIAPPAIRSVDTYHVRAKRIETSLDGTPIGYIETVSINEAYMLPVKESQDGDVRVVEILQTSVNKLLEGYNFKGRFFIEVFGSAYTDINSDDQIDWDYISDLDTRICLRLEDVELTKVLMNELRVELAKEFANQLRLFGFEVTIGEKGANVTVSGRGIPELTIDIGVSKKPYIDPFAGYYGDLTILNESIQQMSRDEIINNVIAHYKRNYTNGFKLSNKDKPVEDWLKSLKRLAFLAHILGEVELQTKIRNLYVDYKYKLNRGESPRIFGPELRKSIEDLLDIFDPEEIGEEELARIIEIQVFGTSQTELEEKWRQVKDKHGQQVLDFLKTVNERYAIHEGIFNILLTTPGTWNVDEVMALINIFQDQRIDNAVIQKLSEYAETYALKEYVFNIAFYLRQVPFKPRSDMNDSELKDLISLNRELIKIGRTDKHFNPMALGVKSIREGLVSKDERQRNYNFLNVAAAKARGVKVAFFDLDGTLVGGYDYEFMYMRKDNPNFELMLELMRQGIKVEIVTTAAFETDTPRASYIYVYLDKFIKYIKDKEEFRSLFSLHAESGLKVYRVTQLGELSEIEERTIPIMRVDTNEFLFGALKQDIIQAVLESEYGQFFRRDDRMGYEGRIYLNQEALERERPGTDPDDFLEEVSSFMSSQREEMLQHYDLSEDELELAMSAMVEIYHAMPLISPMHDYIQISLTNKADTILRTLRYNGFSRKSAIYFDGSMHRGSAARDVFKTGVYCAWVSGPRETSELLGILLDKEESKNDLGTSTPKAEPVALAWNMALKVAEFTFSISGDTDILYFLHIFSPQLFYELRDIRRDVGTVEEFAEALSKYDKTHRGFIYNAAIAIMEYGLIDTTAELASFEEALQKGAMEVFEGEAACPISEVEVKFSETENLMGTAQNGGIATVTRKVSEQRVEILENTEFIDRLKNIGSPELWNKRYKDTRMDTEHRNLQFAKLNGQHEADEYMAINIEGSSNRRLFDEYLLKELRVNPGQLSQSRTTDNFHHFIEFLHELEMQRKLAEYYPENIKLAERLAGQWFLLWFTQYYGRAWEESDLRNGLNELISYIEKETSVVEETINRILAESSRGKAADMELIRQSVNDLLVAIDRINFEFANIVAIGEVLNMDEFLSHFSHWSRTSIAGARGFLELYTGTETLDLLPSVADVVLRGFGKLYFMLEVIRKECFPSEPWDVPVTANMNHKELEDAYTGLAAEISKGRRNAINRTEMRKRFRRKLAEVRAGDITEQERLEVGIVQEIMGEIFGGKTILSSIIDGFVEDYLDRKGVSPERFRDCFSLVASMDDFTDLDGTVEKSRQAAAVVDNIIHEGSDEVFAVYIARDAGYLFETDVYMQEIRDGPKRAGLVYPFKNEQEIYSKMHGVYLSVKEDIGEDDFAAFQKEFNARAKRLFDSDLEAFEQASRLYRQILDTGVLASGRKRVKFVDTFGSGKTPLFVSAVFEYFREETRMEDVVSEPFNILLRRDGLASSPSLVDIKTDGLTKYAQEKKYGIIVERHGIDLEGIEWEWEEHPFYVKLLEDGSLDKEDWPAGYLLSSIRDDITFNGVIKYLEKTGELSDRTPQARPVSKRTEEIKDFGPEEKALVLKKATAVIKDLARRMFVKVYDVKWARTSRYPRGTIEVIVNSKRGNVQGFQSYIKSMWNSYVLQGLDEGKKIGLKVTIITSEESRVAGYGIQTDTKYQAEEIVLNSKFWQWVQRNTDVDIEQPPARLNLWVYALFKAVVGIVSFSIAGVHEAPKIWNFREFIQGHAREGEKLSVLYAGWLGLVTLVIYGLSIALPIVSVATLVSAGLAGISPGLWIGSFIYMILLGIINLKMDLTFFESLTVVPHYAVNIILLPVVPVINFVGGLVGMTFNVIINPLYNSIKNRLIAGIPNELKQKPIVYVTSEIAIQNTVFAGGLGKLAADTAYAASDVADSNMIFMTLLYQGGRHPVEQENGTYTRGFYKSDYSKVDGIEQVMARDERGEEVPLEVELDITGEKIKVKVWKQVIKGEKGASTVYYLDCPSINYELYPDWPWDRFRQELLLGKGSVEVLKALQIQPTVIHMNEAATSFTAPFAMDDEHFKDTRYVFATHTPVKAALRSYEEGWWNRTGIPDKYRGAFVRDGRMQLTQGAMNLMQGDHGMIYGVSEKHEEVSRDMFPEFSHVIHSVTNGSHIGFWRHPDLKKVRSKAKLAEVKKRLKGDMIGRVKELTGVELDEDKPVALFTRRMVEYKRLWMILSDDGIVDLMLKDKEEGGLGMQLVVAGNPYGDYGLWMIKSIKSLQEKYPGKIVYIPGYDEGDLSVNRMLFAGGDFILHIPRLREEASGTSFQMASINGVPSANSQDGAPLEHIKEFDPETGNGNGFMMAQDNREALMDMLRKISDIYYNDADAWRDVSWNAFKSSEGEMSAVRMVKDYYNHLYLPVYKAGKIDSLENMQPGRSVITNVEQGGEVTVTVDLGIHDLSPRAATVELWSNFTGEWRAHKMTPLRQISSIEGREVWQYGITFTPLETGTFKYTVRAGVHDERTGDYKILYWFDGPGNDGIVSVKEREGGYFATQEISMASAASLPLVILLTAALLLWPVWFMGRSNVVVWITRALGMRASPEGKETLIKGIEGIKFVSREKTGFFEVPEASKNTIHVNPFVHAILSEYPRLGKAFLYAQGIIGFEAYHLIHPDKSKSTLKIEFPAYLINRILPVFLGAGIGMILVFSGFASGVWVLIAIAVSIPVITALISWYEFMAWRRRRIQELKDEKLEKRLQNLSEKLIASRYPLKILRDLFELGRPAVPVIIEWLRQTHNKEKEARMLAVDWLGENNYKEALDVFGEIVKEEKDSEVIQRTVRAIGRIQDKKDTAIHKFILSRYIESKDDASIRYLTLKSMAGMETDEAYEILLDRLRNDSDPFVRNEAMESLVKMKYPKAVDVIIERVNEDEAIVVQIFAVRLLGEINDEKAVGPIIDLFHRNLSIGIPSKDLSYVIGYALAGIGTQRVAEFAVELLDEGFYLTLYGILDFNRPMFPELIAWLKNNSGKKDNERSVLIGHMREADIRRETDFIIELLENDQSGDVRAKAAAALGKVRKSKVFKALANSLLNDPISEVRVSAAEALGEQGSPKAVDYLVERLRNDEDYKVRTVSAKSLGLIRSPRAVSILIEKLSTDESPDVRLASADALGEIRTTEAVGPLLDRVRYDEDNTVKMYAVGALERIGDQAAVPYLAEILESVPLDNANLRARIGTVSGNITLSTVNRIINAPANRGVREIIQTVRSDVLRRFLRLQSIVLRAEGQARENWYEFTRSLLRNSPSLKFKPLPRGVKFPEEPEPVDADLLPAYEDVNSLFKTIDAAEGVERMGTYVTTWGRKVLYKRQDGTYFSLKIQKEDEDVEALARERNNLEFLHALKDRERAAGIKDGLKGEWARPAGNDGSIYRVRIPESETVTKTGEQISLAQADGYYTVLVLEETRETLMYLDGSAGMDSSKADMELVRELLGEDIDSTQFENANRMIINDMMKLLEYGIVHPDTIYLYHEELMLRGEERARTGANTAANRLDEASWNWMLFGRMSAPLKSARFSNYRLAGFADVEKLTTISAISEGRYNRRYFSTVGRERPHDRTDTGLVGADPKKIAYYYFGAYLLSLVLTRLSWMDTEEPFVYLGAEDRRQKLAVSLKDTFNQAFVDFSGSEISGLDSVIGDEGWQLMADQLVYFLSGQHAEDVASQDEEAMERLHSMFPGSEVEILSLETLEELDPKREYFRKKSPRNGLMIGNSYNSQDRDLGAINANNPATELWKALCIYSAFAVTENGMKEKKRSDRLIRLWKPLFESLGFWIGYIGVVYGVPLILGFLGVDASIVLSIKDVLMSKTFRLVLYAGLNTIFGLLHKRLFRYNRDLVEWLPDEKPASIPARFGVGLIGALTIHTPVLLHIFGINISSLLPILLPQFLTIPGLFVSIFVLHLVWNNVIARLFGLFALAGSKAGKSVSTNVDRRALLEIFPHQDYLEYLYLYGFGSQLIVNNEDLQVQGLKAKKVFKELRAQWDYISPAANRDKKISLGKVDSKGAIEHFKEIIDYIERNLYILKALIEQEPDNVEEIIEGMEDVSNFADGIKLLLEHKARGSVDVNDVVSKISGLVFSKYYADRYDITVRTGLRAEGELDVSQDKLAYLLLALFVPFRNQNGLEFYINTYNEDGNLVIQIDTNNVFSPTRFKQIGADFIDAVLEELGGALAVTKRGKKNYTIKVTFPLKTETEPVANSMAESLQTLINKINHDYIRHAVEVAQEVSRGERERAIIYCDTTEQAIGTFVAANKFRAVRAVIADLTPTITYDKRNTTVLSRAHNDTNILIIDRSKGTAEERAQIEKEWLETAYEGIEEPRHQERLDMFMEIPEPVPPSPTAKKQAGKTRIAIGCDHGAIELMEALQEKLVEELGLSLKERGIEIVLQPVGVDRDTIASKKAAGENINYPEYGQKVARIVLSGESDLGIVQCGTGFGICMSLEKFAGMRGVVTNNVDAAVVAREKFDANVIALGGRIFTEDDKSVHIDEVLEIIKAWLETEPSPEAAANIEDIETAEKIAAMQSEMSNLPASARGSKIAAVISGIGAVLVPVILWLVGNWIGVPWIMYLIRALSISAGLVLISGSLAMMNQSGYIKDAINISDSKRNNDAISRKQEELNLEIREVIEELNKKYEKQGYVFRDFEDRENPPGEKIDGIAGIDPNNLVDEKRRKVIYIDALAFGLLPEYLKKHIIEKHEAVHLRQFADILPPVARKGSGTDFDELVKYGAKISKKYPWFNPVYVLAKPNSDGKQAYFVISSDSEEARRVYDSPEKYQVSVLFETAFENREGELVGYQGRALFHPCTIEGEDRFICYHGIGLTPSFVHNPGRNFAVGPVYSGFMARDEAEKRSDMSKKLTSADSAVIIPEVDSIVGLEHVWSRNTGLVGVEDLGDFFIPGEKNNTDWVDPVFVSYKPQPLEDIITLEDVLEMPAEMQERVIRSLLEKKGVIKKGMFRKKIDKKTLFDLYIDFLLKNVTSQVALWYEKGYTHGMISRQNISINGHLRDLATAKPVNFDIVDMDLMSLDIVLRMITDLAGYAGMYDRAELIDSIKDKAIHLLRDSFTAGFWDKARNHILSIIAVDDPSWNKEFLIIEREWVLLDIAQEFVDAGILERVGRDDDCIVYRVKQEYHKLSREQFDWNILRDHMAMPSNMVEVANGNVSTIRDEVNAGDKEKKSGWRAEVAPYTNQVIGSISILPNVIRDIIRRALFAARRTANVNRIARESVEAQMDGFSGLRQQYPYAVNRDTVHIVYDERNLESKQKELAALKEAGVNAHGVGFIPKGYNLRKNGFRKQTGIPNLVVRINDRSVPIDVWKNESTGMILIQRRLVNQEALTLYLLTCQLLYRGIIDDDVNEMLIAGQPKSRASNRQSLPEVIFIDNMGMVPGEALQSFNPVYNEDGSVTLSFDALKVTFPDVDKAEDLLRDAEVIADASGVHENMQGFVRQAKASRRVNLVLERGMSFMQRFRKIWQGFLTNTIQSVTSWEVALVMDMSVDEFGVSNLAERITELRDRDNSMWTPLSTLMLRDIYVEDSPGVLTPEIAEKTAELQAAVTKLKQAKIKVSVPVRVTKEEQLQGQGLNNLITNMLTAGLNGIAYDEVYLDFRAMTAPAQQQAVRTWYQGFSREVLSKLPIKKVYFVLPQGLQDLSEDNAVMIESPRELDRMIRMVKSRAVNMKCVVIPSDYYERALSQAEKGERVTTIGVRTKIMRLITRYEPQNPQECFEQSSKSGEAFFMKRSGELLDVNMDFYPDKFKRLCEISDMCLENEIIDEGLLIEVPEMFAEEGRIRQEFDRLVDRIRHNDDMEEQVNAYAEFRGFLVGIACAMAKARYISDIKFEAPEYESAFLKLLLIEIANLDEGIDINEVLKRVTSVEYEHTLPERLQRQSPHQIIAPYIGNFGDIRTWGDRGRGVLVTDLLNILFTHYQRQEPFIVEEAPQAAIAALQQAINAAG
ncbi:MAG: HEAT repeat domain-containing protein [Endomicrobiales bacterium]|nr:HEAT repeat domain-containing protein [Endomicrobiales bacterium]